LVGLRKHCHTGLGKDLVPYIADHLAGHVGVPNPRLGGLEVFGADVYAAHGVLEPVLVGTEVSALLVDECQGGVNGGYGAVGAFGGFQAYERSRRRHRVCQALRRSWCR